ncbi:hypothetical protein E8D34_17750 [Nocardioides sp. GY 10113]|uniref:DUF5995 family protein n=1 Tax=Nocardioides sp. GY 10113 TaxID=2569761 RepID=UPI0010A80AC4|nr:DUF5995 family protein [Nocardioides sp. GY 10113]TIC81526.1 hypothetical protein E8D34_17750 [Nocardioides sp. GY 10113]
MTPRRTLRARLAAAAATVVAMACGVTLGPVGPAHADEPVVIVEPVPDLGGDPLPVVEVTKPCGGVADYGPRQRRRLVRITDPRRIDRLPPMAALRRGARVMAEVAPTLVRANDRRGIFAVFYGNILGEAAPALADGSSYDDPAWSRKVSITFFRPYLAALHASLANQRVPKNWRTYYRLAADCSVSPGRVAMAGLDAHLILDFPVAIARSGARPAHFGDYYAIGELLQDATVDIGEDLKRTYGADLTEFFHLWALGDSLDSVAGDGATTTLLFQGIRTVAFSYGLGLRSDHGRLTRAAMRATYYAAESVSDALTDARLI